MAVFTGQSYRMPDEIAMKQVMLGRRNQIERSKLVTDEPFVSHLDDHILTTVNNHQF